MATGAFSFRIFTERKIAGIHAILREINEKNTAAKSFINLKKRENNSTIQHKFTHFVRYWRYDSSTQ